MIEVEFSSGAEVWKSLMGALHDLKFTPPANALLQFSMPKSGTHLLRNILLGFVGPGAYDNGPWFFGHPDMLRDGKPYIKIRANALRTLHAGFDVFSEAMSQAEQPPHCTVLLVRNPADTLMSLARQTLNTTLDRPDFKWMRDNLAFPEILRCFAEGYSIEGRRYSGIRADLETYAVSWLPHADVVVRFEDLKAASQDTTSDASEAFFSNLLPSIGITTPDDWQERVTRLSAGDVSATFARSKTGDRSELDAVFDGQWLETARDLVGGETMARLGYA